MPSRQYHAATCTSILSITRTLVNDLSQLLIFEKGALETLTPESEVMGYIIRGEI